MPSKSDENHLLLLKTTSKTLIQLANIIDTIAIDYEEKVKSSHYNKGLKEPAKNEVENNKTKFYTFKEACELLGIGRHGLYNLINSGKLKGFKIGSLWRFTDEEIERYIRSEMEKS